MALEVLDQILNKHVIKLNRNEVVGGTKDKLAGAAFIVVSKDKVLYQGAAGYVSLPESSSSSAPAPFSATRSFTWVASMTKVFTSTCLMHHIERGGTNIDLRFDVRAHSHELASLGLILKGFQTRSDGVEEPVFEEFDNLKSITIRHLLTHTAGLGYDIADPDLTKWSQLTGRKVNNLSFTLEGWSTPLKFAPGQGWYYGSALDWAGHFLECNSGKSLGEYMAQYIFEPLGLCHTTFRSEKLLAATKDIDPVRCTSRDPNTGELVTIPLPVPVDPPVESGGAGLWTTAEDYSKLLQELLKAKAGDSEAVLKKESVDEMFRPQLNEVQHAMLKVLTDMFHDGMVAEFPPGMPINHGLAGIINMEDVPGKRRKGSMMWQGMAGSKWWIDPETGIGAALIVNIIKDADPVVIKLYDELERAVYAQLVPEEMGEKTTLRSGTQDEV
ncbi:acyltransferase LovD [Rhypophila decipiens]